VPARDLFEYAVIRVVPRVEREEFVNAGVIVFSKARNFLAARVRVDERRILALWPDADLDLIRQHLDAIPRVCAGTEAGPIGALSQRERFHWLVAPRSTMIQVSAVHGGLCDSPDDVLQRLFDQFVPAAAVPEVQP
jgi:hypothetical protein